MLINWKKSSYVLRPLVLCQVTRTIFHTHKNNGRTIICTNHLNRPKNSCSSIQVSGAVGSSKISEALLLLTVTAYLVGINEFN